MSGHTKTDHLAVNPKPIMATNNVDVERKLGDAVKKIKKYSNKTSIRKLGAFAQRLPEDPEQAEEMFGRHRARATSNQEHDLKEEMNWILSDWWECGLNGMDQEKAFKRLIQVCAHTNVGFHLLAKELQELHDIMMILL